MNRWKVWGKRGRPRAGFYTLEGPPYPRSPGPTGTGTRHCAHLALGGVGQGPVPLWQASWRVASFFCADFEMGASMARRCVPQMSVLGRESWFATEAGQGSSAMVER